jgi:hypothetical protein
LQNFIFETRTGVGLFYISGSGEPLTYEAQVTLRLTLAPVGIL